MADDADVAGDLVNEFTTQVVANRAQLPEGASNTWCEGCDAVIPQRRRALGGVRLCVECKTFEEARRG